MIGSMLKSLGPQYEKLEVRRFFILPWVVDFRTSLSGALISSGAQVLLSQWQLVIRVKLQMSHVSGLCGIEADVTQMSSFYLPEHQFNKYHYKYYK